MVQNINNIKGNKNKISNTNKDSSKVKANNSNINAGKKNKIQTEDLQNNQRIDSFKQTNKNNVTLINDFQVNADLLNKFAKSVDSLSESSEVKSNKKLLALVEKIKLNPFHSLILNITSIMESNINDKKLILNFIKTYMDILKNSNLSLKGALQEERKSSSIINILKLNFETYLKDIISLLKLLNTTKKPEDGEDAATSNINKTGNFDPTASASKPAAPAPAPMNEKKNKYSKKASEFIGKEISHLKKDKGYPQDRAKDKGMKVGAKKK